MTDEEKAEEYANNEINKMFVDESEEVYVRASTLKQIIKNSHLKGLAEGEKIGKEKQWKATEKAQKKTSAKIKELEKENAELKEQIENRNCPNCRRSKAECPNDGSCHNFSLWQPFINPELTKAKEIIKDYLTIIKGSHTTVCGVPEENRTIHVLKLNEEAEQFIKE